MLRSRWLLAAVTLHLSLATPSDVAKYYDSPRLLLFWPVDGSYRTVKQVKKNLDYVKSTLGAGCCDVFLAHYKGDAKLFGDEWYRKNVVGNLSGTGYKFKFMQAAYNKAQFEEPWETKYDFVWGLDSDVDLTGTNLTKLFRMVKQSNALIAGPTFVGAGVNQRHPGGDLRRKAQRLKRKNVAHQVEVMPDGIPALLDNDRSRSNDRNLGAEAERKNVAHQAEVMPDGIPALLDDYDRSNEKDLGAEASMSQDSHDVGSSSGAASSIWRFERPDPNCDYRHTDFVELTAPILTMVALPMIFNDCSNCIHDKSDWGLDMVWCNFLASEAKQASGCALIDATPVNHLNWKQALPSKVFYEANREVHRKYRRFWSHFKTFSCVVVEPAVSIPMQGLELGHRLVRKESG